MSRCHLQDYCRKIICNGERSEFSYSEYLPETEREFKIGGFKKIAGNGIFPCPNLTYLTYDLADLLGESRYSC